MVNTCSAPGCQTGYKKVKTSKRERASGIHDVSDDIIINTQTLYSLYKFPIDETLKNKWIGAIPRLNWIPTDNARLCEKHFLSSDFKDERDDKNRGRNKKRGAFVRKILKQDAVPSVWPESDGDSFITLVELEDKFSLGSISVDSIIKKKEYILFLSLKSEETPAIKYGMKLFENLHMKCGVMVYR